MRWTLPAGQKIVTLWTGKLEQDGSAVTVRNEGYNATVAANGSAEFGFTADGAAVRPSTVTCETPR